MLLRSLPQRGFRIGYLKQQSRRSRGNFCKTSRAVIKISTVRLKKLKCLPLNCGEMLATCLFPLYLHHILTIELDIRFSFFFKCLEGTPLSKGTCM